VKFLSNTTFTIYTLLNIYTFANTNYCKSLRVRVRISYIYSII